MARRRARDGFAVIVNYAGRAGDAEALVGAIERDGGRALAVQADVSDAAAVTRMFDAAEAAYGGVDVLVNNAGIMRSEERRGGKEFDSTCSFRWSPYH